MGKTGWRRTRHAPRFQFFYPVPTLAEIDDMAGGAGKQFGVDPQLVRAVIQVESGFNTNAVSRKGAQGLMQLIPDTARRFGVHSPFDPRQNIAGGVAYLKHLLALFSGDVSLAVAAYNAGENAVLRWGGIPPYPETIDYVHKVTGLYAVCPLGCWRSAYAGCGGEEPAGSEAQSHGLTGLLRKAWHTSIDGALRRVSFPLLSF